VFVSTELKFKTLGFTVLLLTNEKFLELVELLDPLICIYDPEMMINGPLETDARKTAFTPLAGFMVSVRLSCASLFF
jgi:hypothetical protein